MRGLSPALAWASRSFRFSPRPSHLVEPFPFLRKHAREGSWICWSASPRFASQTPTPRPSSASLGPPPASIPTAHPWPRSTGNRQMLRKGKIPGKSTQSTRIIGHVRAGPRFFWRRRWMDSPAPTASASFNISLFARFSSPSKLDVRSPPGTTFRLTSVRNADRRRPPALKGKVGRLELHLDCPCNETFAFGLEPAVRGARRLPSRARQWTAVPLRSPGAADGTNLEASKTPATGGWQNAMTFARSAPRHGAPRPAMGALSNPLCSKRPQHHVVRPAITLGCKRKRACCSKRGRV